MNKNRNARDCPVCAGPAGDKAFPYATQFAKIDFDYLKCKDCGATFVDPIPDAATFARMYAKETYHDIHYSDVAQANYEQSARLLSTFLPKGSKVLDYGCGAGAFLRALKNEGFLPTGVEFDEEAANFAGKNVGCPAFSVADFLLAPPIESFDALHLGDVLEHLPQPGETLNQLLKFVKPGGLVFAEGPIENNPSPVFWAARTFGFIKRFIRRNTTATGAPTHLLRVNARQQALFFNLTAPQLSVLHWHVYESGWPYADSCAIKRVIASVASPLGGKKFKSTTFGNRFQAILRIPESI